MNRGLGGFGLFENGETLSQIFSGRPEEKKCGDDARVDWGEGNGFEHDPADDEKQTDCAGFAGPMGFDFHLDVFGVENLYSDQDQAVA